MSFYCKNLESTIFNAHEREVVETPDELIIISGYLGPGPVDRLKQLPFKTTVIAGMYKLGVNSKLYSSLRNSMKKNPNLSVYFSNIEVHSKIYIWMKRGIPKYVLIGSANFSDNGLRTDYRESLADMDIRNTSQLLDYYDLILSNSTETPEILSGKTDSSYYSSKYKGNGKSLVVNDDINNGELTVELPLYVQKNKMRYVPEKSGLNWGLSNGHTAEGDAYIRIPKSLTKDIPDFFVPYDPSYKSKNKRKRASDPIEIIWDDGTVMEASAEGKQISPNGLEYPKQIASYSLNTRKLKISAKSILGRYIRRRMKLPVDYEIKYSDLEKYGRTTITFTKVSDGVYSANFSV